MTKTSQFSGSLNPPFADLLRSNTPPSQTEVAQIQERIEIVKKQLNQMIVGGYYDGIPKKLVPRNAHPHLRFINTHQALISNMKIRNLPAEILEEIFFDVFHSSYHWQSRAKLPLTQTCRYWREVALSSPRLWCQLPKISIGRDDDRKREASRLHTLNLYLQRSRDHPIKFSYSAPRWRKKIAISSQTLRLLVKHSHQWEDVSIAAGIAVLQNLTQIRGRLPRLHTLKLNISTAFLDDVTFDYFSVAPMLRKAEILCYAGFSQKTTIELPWSQLDVYTENSSHDVGYTSVLASAADLTSLNCSTFGFDFIFIPPSTLSKLTRFHLKISAIRMMSAHILENLTLPCLSDLELRGRPDGTLFEEVLELIRRSACPLCRLALDGSLMATGIISAILSLSPLLEELDVAFIPPHDLARLTFDPLNVKPLAPALQRLIIRYPYPIINDEGNEFLDAELTEMARSRIDFDKQYESLLKRLDLRILFHTENMCDRQLEILEGWPVTPANDRSGIESMVFKWKEILQRELTYWRPGRFHKVKPSYLIRIPNLLEKTFQEMERYQIAGSDLTLLYQAKIPCLLVKASEMSFGSIPGDRRHKFHQRAKVIFERWKPFLILDTWSRRWAHEGRSTLAYVSADHWRRATEDVIDIMIGYA